MELNEMNQKSAVTKIELFLFAAVLIMLATMFASGARASGWAKPPPPAKIEAEAEAEANATAQAQADATAGAKAGSYVKTGDTTAQGGTGEAVASNDGNTLDAGDNTTNSKTTFFSFNSSIPAAGKCFGAVNGGGGDSGGGGFLGLNFLNKDCWYSALAAEEKSVEVRARLKCGSKAFRNAIAYTEPRKTRQQYCVAYMSKKFVEQIKFEQAEVQAMLDSQTILINDHTTKETVRTSDSVTRAVEKCTDCFGQK